MSKRVLFVCSGNIFRSVIAEYCLKKFIKDNHIKGWEVSSAGTSEIASLKHPYLVNKMIDMGMGEVIHHKRRELLREYLENNDFVIAMAKYHKDFIMEKYGNESVSLFTNLVGDVFDDVYDIGDLPGDTRTANEVIDDTVNYICTRTPRLFEVLNKL